MQHSWAALVQQAAGPEREPVVYIFGQGREFKEPLAMYR